MKVLEQIREEIDQIDQELVRLLEKRYICVDEVVRIKKEHDLPVLDNNREKLVLKKISNQVKDDKYQESIVKTFQDIMNTSKKYQNEQ